ncbi:High mobility group protein [Rhynchospora pubera]|uniref:High mobility group protein n=1 Tax=Rhynchospora pubera TaxID=906938 RepID=A0AAV8DYV6_9POAL|nr:High mobility group protein [Rhynchospora pubera]
MSSYWSRSFPRSNSSFLLRSGYASKSSTRSIASSAPSSMKKKAAEKAKPAKRSQAAKDPNKPLRPPSAFFDFMEEFRKTFKEKNYNNKSVYVVGKTGGDKWKILSEAKKAPNVAKANKIKSEYNSKMNAYNKKQS